MKDILKAQLDTFEFDNSKQSKQAILDSLNSLKGATIGAPALNAVENAKEALNSTTAKKSTVISTVEYVINNLN